MEWTRACSKPLKATGKVNRDVKLSSNSNLLFLFFSFVLTNPPVPPLPPPPSMTSMQIQVGWYFWMLHVLDASGDTILLGLTSFPSLVARSSWNPLALQSTGMYSCSCWEDSEAPKCLCHLPECHRLPPKLLLLPFLCSQPPGTGCQVSLEIPA